VGKIAKSRAGSRANVAGDFAHAFLHQVFSRVGKSLTNSA